MTPAGPPPPGTTVFPVRHGASQPIPRTAPPRDGLDRLLRLHRGMCIRYKPLCICEAPFPLCKAAHRRNPSPPESALSSKTFPISIGCRVSLAATSPSVR